nr:MAG TPA: hypothetical protein [Caudoviricetes sp.]
MSARVTGVTEEGFDEVMKKLENLADYVIEDASKKTLKNFSKYMKGEMISVAPVSKVRNIHGYECIDTSNMRVSRQKYNFYISVGLSETIRNGTGADYWHQIRGLWFQNFKTDEPNYNWFEKNFRTESKKASYQKKLSDELEKELLSRLTAF